MPSHPLRALVLEARSFRACVQAGMFRLDRPSVMLRGIRALRRYGSMGGVLDWTAARYPDRVAVVDERGSVTYAELAARTDAIALAWLERGFQPGGSIAILARNHRGFVDAAFAASKVGARIILLNTDFAGPQLADVCAREGVEVLVHDEAYADVVASVDVPLGTYLAWTDGAPPEHSLEALIAAGSGAKPPAPPVRHKVIILTSGTTGRPKGTERPDPRSLVPVGALFFKVRYRSGDVLECCPPMFHSFGYAQMMLSVVLGQTLVVRRTFDPAETLASLARNKVTTLVGVPVMLRRIVDLGPDARAGLDLSRLRIILVTGSQLGADLAVRATEAFGPVLHNLYASTEVAYASVATPEELAIEPGCVGSVVAGAQVKILDEHGQELPTGRTGRIFVANGVQFSGYTGGGGKEVVDGLMSSGDVGHFDHQGLLFVDGRDDDMIISGGENLFPGEVEELLAAHPGIVEVAAIGVPDEEFGTRLHAFVVRKDEDLTSDAVKRHVRDNLARYKVPREVTFLDELPRNPAGKVLKLELSGLAGPGPEVARGEQRAPFGSALLGPATQSPKRLRVRLQLLLTAMLVTTHLIGAGVVFVISVFVLPTEPLTSRSVVALAISVPTYVGLAVLVGGFWGTISSVRRLRWANEGRTPTAKERRIALRTPIRLTLIQGALWAVAVVVFVVETLVVQPDRALGTGLAIGISGLVVSTVAYLQTEFAMRPIAAQALTGHAGRRRGMTGVQARMLLFWGIGTAAPVVGMAIAAVVALTSDDMSKDRLAIIALALAGVVLVFGLLVTVLNARSVVAPISTVRYALGRVRKGDLTTEVTVFDGTELGLLQAGFNDMVVGLREREAIRDMFGRHVGKDVAAAAAAGQVTLGGETRVVSVLFIDLIGSTAYATERSPQEVVETLNRFLAVVVAEVDEHGGFVNKFMGDAALAIFGAPVDDERHAAAALATARAIAARLTEEVSEIEAGIGVATGEAVAGNIGDESRFEYTVIGDSVNSAARLCDLAKNVPGHVLVARASVEQAGPEEASYWEPDSDHVLRGRSAPTPTSRLRRV